MPLAPGTHLGPYEIGAPLGAGGMGEVYRARDKRLERTVAIKILPAQFSSDPVRKQRFEREAKTISSLNHPNICTLHDIGHQDGTDYLVMECVEGETLAKRLEKGPLPLDQVLKCGAQIADALDKAHRSGVVHRDLKPGNIMLTPTGAKLLDFGLAKPATPLATSVTLTAAAPNSPVTEQGTIIGTFQYMSPEQVEGKELDGRSDIFSLGAVLYEMLTGQRAFPGKSQLSVASAILEKEPEPISTTKPMTPPALDHAVKKCLAKMPDERWQSASDLASELKWVAEAGSQAGVPAPVVSRRRLRERLTQAAAALMTLIAIVFAISWAVRAPRPPQLMRFAIPPPEEAKFVSGPPWGSPLVVSPDGQSIVFVAAGKDGKRRLWVRPLESLAAQPLLGTEDASAPFWSPDNKWVAFFANGRLMRVAATGGEAQTLCQCQSGGGGGTWNQDNVVLFSPAVAGASGLSRIPAAGGTPLSVTTLDAANGETNHVWPVFLPDGRHFLYNINGGDRSGIYVGDLQSPKNPRLMPLNTKGISTLAYAPPGYLLYVRDRVLFAQPFDATRLVLAGDPIRVVEGVENAGPGSAAFSVSSTGVLVYWSGAVPRNEQLTWVRRDGTRITAIGPPGPYFHFSLSPDERRVAVTRYEPGERVLHTAIWLLDVLRGTSTKFTFEWGAGMPVWSPDANRIVFSSARGGPPTLYQKSVGGVQGQDELLVKGGDNHPTDWAPDGRTIVYEVYDAKTRNDIWLLSLAGAQKPVSFFRSPFNETGGRISPDGRWMAYASDESGRDEIYLTNYPEPRGKWRISTEGGTQAEWRRDGRELFYRSPHRKLMAVPIRSGKNFDAGTPQPLFDIPPDAGPWIQGGVDQREYAVSSDGQRFLIGIKVGEESSAPLTVIVNWTAEVKK